MDKAVSKIVQLLPKGTRVCSFQLEIFTKILGWVIVILESRKTGRCQVRVGTLSTVCALFTV